MNKQQGTLRLNLIQFLPLYLIKTDWFSQVSPDIGNGHAEALSSNGHDSQYSSMNSAKNVILADKRTKNSCKNKNKKSFFFVQLSRKVFVWEGSEEPAVSSLPKHDPIWDQFSTAASIFSHKVLNVQLSPSKRSLAKLGDKYGLRGVYFIITFSPTQL